MTFNGVKWVVEGDIKGAYDNVDHKILIRIPEERIDDQRFIHLISKALKAGYLESNLGLIKPLIGTPQGSLVSPILANIYLDKLDRHVDIIKNEYEQVNNKKPWKGRGEFTTEYNDLRNQIRNKETKVKKSTITDYKERKVLVEEIMKLKVQLRNTISKKPETVPIKIQYVRYADDWIVGINGPQYIAKEIKEKISSFLKNELGLKLSDEKQK